MALLVFAHASSIGVDGHSCHPPDGGTVFFRATVDNGGAWWLDVGMSTAERTSMLAPLTIGQTYFVPKEAQMADHGLATVTADHGEGVYEITYPSGITETLTDTAEAAPCW